jgi:cytidyltransferase-like protein
MSKIVTAFGRMNPPTTGHLKLIDAVHSIADKENAVHSVIVSGSHDPKKNPLSPQQKLKHLNRYSPRTNFTAASKNSPTLLHHLSKLHDAGHSHLIYVGGSDRTKDMEDLINRYNGVHGKHGYYNFKKIEVRSAGHRDPDSEGTEGMSGTKMREHASNNDFESFRKGVPNNVSDDHARELMHDVRSGMSVKESYIQNFLSRLRLM